MEWAFCMDGVSCCIFGHGVECDPALENFVIPLDLLRYQLSSA